MKKILLGLIVLALFVTAFLLVNRPESAQGSVAVGQEYYATTTEATLSTSSCMPILTSYKTLGSVIVTLGSNAGLRIYDATTTAAYAYGASSTIASFKTTATAGTYTFDVRAKRGICVMSEGSVGVASTTITWKY
jgi:hypothetical protein